jgi:hypothetical protein
MFNSKLKQEIATLQIANQQLQEQYNLVHGLLLQRQDEVVSLQRTLRQEPQSKLPDDFYPDLKDKVRNIVNENTDDILKERVGEDIADQVADYLGEIIDPIFYPNDDECDDLNEDEE